MTRGAQIIRYLLAFALGAIVGGTIIDILAARALKAQVINVRARLYAEQSILAARARCREDWFSVALRRALQAAFEAPALTDLLPAILFG